MSEYSSTKFLKNLAVDDLEKLLIDVISQNPVDEQMLEKILSAMEKQEK
jgi:hypothetical protein